MAKGKALMAALSERNEGSATSEPSGTGGPDEAATYIKSALAELAQMARRHRLDTLGFLLDMAQMEAAEIVRRERDARS